MDKFKELWANPRYKAIVKLGLWFVFFLIIIIVCSFSAETKTPVLNNNEEEKEVVIFKSLAELKDKLLNSNVNYLYKLTNYVENSTTIFNGNLFEGIDVGYYESKTEIYKYSCTLEKCYKVFTDHQEEFQIDNYPLLFITNVFAKFNELEAETTIDKETKTYTYLEDVQGVEWKTEIKTSLSDITSIKLTTQKEMYEINFEY